MISTRTETIRHCDSANDWELRRRIMNYLRLRLPDLETVDIDAQNGTAVLRGTVSSRSLKWRCLGCCRHVAGVHIVIDRLVVLPSHDFQDRFASAPTPTSDE